MAVNSVNIAGNLTRESEIRRTQSGSAVLSFSVAINERRKDQSGEWVDSPVYVDCVMFGSRAEKLADYLHKGTKVAVSGKLRFSSWEKEGRKYSKLDVVVDEIEFMSKGDKRKPEPEYVEATYLDEPPF